MSDVAFHTAPPIIGLSCFELPSVSPNAIKWWAFVLSYLAALRIFCRIRRWQKSKQCSKQSENSYCLKKLWYWTKNCRHPFTCVLLILRYCWYTHLMSRLQIICFLVSKKCVFSVYRYQENLIRVSIVNCGVEQII